MPEADAPRISIRDRIGPPGLSAVVTYRHVVYAKPTWTDDWQVADDLFAVSASWRAFPGISEAQLVYDYGRMIRPARGLDVRYDPAIAYMGWYVVIVAVPSIGGTYPVWAGVIPSEQFNVEGATVVGSQVFGRGQITITAFGFAYLLNRRRVYQGHVADDPGGNPRGTTVQWMPPFNVRARQGSRPIGNRGVAKLQGPPFGGGGDEGVAHGFSNVRGANNLPPAFSYLDIIEHLLYYSDPNPSTDDPHFEIMGDRDFLEYLGLVVDYIDANGQTVFATLRKMLDRRRGIGAHIEWTTKPLDPDDPENVNRGLPWGNLRLWLYSLTDEAIPVGDKVMPANPSQDIIGPIDSLATDLGARVTVDSLSRFETIVVQGNKAVSCFTVDLDDGDPETEPDTSRAMVEAAWDAADETAYKAADDASRKRARFDRVYRLFRLPTDFNWKTRVAEPPEGHEEGDPVGGGFVLNRGFTQFAEILPNDDGDNGENRNAAPFWNALKHWARWLPVEHPADAIAEDPELRFLRPFALLEKQNDAGGTGVWAHAEKPGEDPDGTSYGTSAGFRLVDHGMAIEVDFPVNHTLAVGEFDPLVDDSVHAPRFSSKTGMIATVAIETDTRPSVKIVVPVDPIDEGSVWTIDVDADCHYVLNGTVIGLAADGSLALHTGPEVLRDETDRLREIAALAQAWYGKKRSRVTITRHGLVLTDLLGTFITRVIYLDFTEQVVGSAITEVAFDFVGQTTTATTGSMILDVTLGVGVVRQPPKKTPPPSKTATPTAAPSPSGPPSRPPIPRKPNIGRDGLEILASDKGL